MIRRALIAAVTLSLLPSCMTTASRLSRSAYNHETRAYQLRAMGQYGAADAQQAAASQDRYRMARIGHAWASSYPRL